MNAVEEDTYKALCALPPAVLRPQILGVHQAFSVFHLVLPRVQAQRWVQPNVEGFVHLALSGPAVSAFRPSKGPLSVNERVIVLAQQLHIPTKVGRF